MMTEKQILDMRAGIEKLIENERERIDSLCGLEKVFVDDRIAYHQHAISLIDTILEGK